jgi:hypothetical protein
LSPAKYDILILDDGELGEIREAAHAIDAAVHTELDGPDTPVEWSVVISSARNLQRLESIPVNVSAKRVLVLDQLSQTLRARMRRARVDFFLCRPVHPEALRLLLLHCLYKGPERRQHRVAVGAPVKFRSGFRRGRGVLADLSDTGCRILTPDPLASNQRLLVFLPRAERRGRTFFVRAEVVRVSRRAQLPHQMALRFCGVSGSAQRRIAELIALHEKGPAVFRDGARTVAPAGIASDVAPQDREPPETIAAEPEALESDGGDAARPSLELDDDATLLEGEEAERQEAAPPFREAEEPRPASPAEAPELAGEPFAQEVPEDRRREPRRAFDRHVVALDRSATRILIGRDLSVGGMRVDPNPALRPLKTFRLSIHVGEGELPLVVRARVVRDDGEEGIVLQFEQLGFAVQEHLRKSLRELPILAPGDDGAPEGVLVTEILGDREEGWLRPRRGPGITS